jgi:uncharacterized membrane protein YeaQ/YmgE (transglycosylase-associated protein family)
MLSSPQIVQIIYGVVGVLAAFFIYSRLMAGEWLSAVFPALILAWCVYRLSEDREQDREQE